MSKVKDKKARNADARKVPGYVFGIGHEKNAGLKDLLRPNPHDRKRRYGSGITRRKWKRTHSG